MSNALLGRLLVASAALALSACGGGGGGGGFRSTPPPPPTPPLPPPPPPPVLASPAIFPTITSNTDFAVLGLEAADRNVTTPLARDGFSVRFDAATRQYLIDLPSTQAAEFVSQSEDAAYWHGYLNTQDPYLSILKPSSTNPEIQLTYTSLAVTNGYYTRPFGFVAFGSPTPASGVPTTGTATYNSLVRGATLDSFALIRGNATLNFDFGAGTLSGRFDPVHELNGVSTSLGSYQFENTVFGSGNTIFSGALSHAGTSTRGGFEGRFTGPAAQELMSRWTAPYLRPGSQQWADMFGVWVGKRP